MVDKPVTREEKYLAYLTGDYTGEIPKPITRKEKYLYELCLKGIGGEISPEEIKNAVNEYLEKNPVKPGATTEQARQIEQNKTNIASLKEDLSNKITKFYASNQGETHLADSDNGKIMDMMLYGKSEQKQYTGYQLLNDIFEKGSIDVNTGELVESDSNLRTKFFSKIKAGKEYHIELPKDVTIAFRYYADENTYISSYAASNSTRFSTPESTTLLKAVLINNNIYSNNILLSDVMDRYIYEPYTGGQSSPSPDYPQEIKSVVDPTVKVSNEDGTKSQTVTLPYTLNAIPVESGGNVTIDGQQYIADYVDVERGKLVKMVDSSKLDNTQSIVDKTEWLLAEQQEIDLTQEEVQALKTLATYYPTTDIFINSEQLDGYTVFNYPISMANGWNYVKKQLNDNRDYIYDMDIQSAEAYVNSEYAVALTELEV